MKKNNEHSFKSWLHSSSSICFLMILGTFLIILGLFFCICTPKKYDLRVGTISHVTINATKDVEDIVATEDTICNGGEVTLTATLENYNLEYLRYQWYKDELTEANRILGAHEPVYTVMPDASTTYYVEVYSSLTNSSSPYAALTDLCTALDTFRVEVVNDPVIDSVVISGTPSKRERN